MLPKRPFTTSSLTSTLKSTIASQPLLSNLTSIDKLSSHASSLAHKTPFFNLNNAASSPQQQPPNSDTGKQNVSGHSEPSGLVTKPQEAMIRNMMNPAAQTASKKPPGSSPCQPDMSHLTEEERLMIQSVMAKAEMSDMGIPVDTSVPSSTNMPSQVSQALTQQEQAKQLQRNQHQRQQQQQIHQQQQEHQQQLMMNQMHQGLSQQHPSNNSNISNVMFQPEQTRNTGNSQINNQIQRQQQHVNQSAMTNQQMIQEQQQLNNYSNQHSSLPHEQQIDGNNNNLQAHLYTSGANILQQQQQQQEFVEANLTNIQSIGQQTQQLVNQINSQFNLNSNNKLQDQKQPPMQTMQKSSMIQQNPPVRAQNLDDTQYQLGNQQHQFVSTSTLSQPMDMNVNNGIQNLNDSIMQQQQQQQQYQQHQTHHEQQHQVTDYMGPVQQQQQQPSNFRHTNVNQGLSQQVSSGNQPFRSQQVNANANMNTQNYMMQQSQNTLQTPEIIQCPTTSSPAPNNSELYQQRLGEQATNFGPHAHYTGSSIAPNMQPQNQNQLEQQPRVVMRNHQESLSERALFDISSSPQNTTMQSPYERKSPQVTKGTRQLPQPNQQQHYSDQQELPVDRVAAVSASGPQDKRMSGRPNRQVVNVDDEHLVGESDEEEEEAEVSKGLRKNNRRSQHLISKESLDKTDALRMLSELKIAEQANQVMEQQQMLIKQSQEMIKLQLEQQAASQKLKKSMFMEAHESRDQALINTSSALNDGQESQVAAGEPSKGNNSKISDRKKPESSSLAETVDKRPVSDAIDVTKEECDEDTEHSTSKLEKRGPKEQENSKGLLRYKRPSVDSPTHLKEDQHSRPGSRPKRMDKTRNMELTFQQPPNRLHTRDHLQSPGDTTDSDIEPQSSSNYSNRHQSTSRAGNQQQHGRLMKTPIAKRREPSGLPPSPLPVAAAIQLHQMQQQSSSGLSRNPLFRSRSVTNSPNHMLHHHNYQQDHSSSYLTGHYSKSRPSSPDTMSEHGGFSGRIRKRLPEPPINAVPMTPSMVRKLIQSQRATASGSTKLLNSVNTQSTMMTNLHSSRRGGSSLLDKNNSLMAETRSLRNSPLMMASTSMQPQTTFPTSAPEIIRDHHFRTDVSSSDLNKFLSSTYGNSILKNNIEEVRDTSEMDKLIGNLDKYYNLDDTMSTSRRSNTVSTSQQLSSNLLGSLEASTQYPSQQPPASSSYLDNNPSSSLSFLTSNRIATSDSYLTGSGYPSCRRNSEGESQLAQYRYNLRKGSLNGATNRGNFTSSYRQADLYSDWTPSKLATSVYGSEQGRNILSSYPPTSTAPINYTKSSHEMPTNYQGLTNSSSYLTSSRLRGPAASLDEPDYRNCLNLHHHYSATPSTYPGYNGLDSTEHLRNMYPNAGSQLVKDRYSQATREADLYLNHYNPSPVGGSYLDTSVGYKRDPTRIHLNRQLLNQPRSLDYGRQQYSGSNQTGYMGSSYVSRQQESGGRWQQSQTTSELNPCLYYPRRGLDVVKDNYNDNHQHLGSLAGQQNALLGLATNSAASLSKTDILNNGLRFDSIGYRFRTENQNKYVTQARLPAPCLQPKYPPPYKRILLSKNPKDRIGNGIGLRIAGGQPLPSLYDRVNKCIVTTGAFVSEVFKGSETHFIGELQEGDQIIEWNGVDFCNRSNEEVQQILLSQLSDEEVEIVYLPRNKIKLAYDTTSNVSQLAPTEPEEQDIFNRYADMNKSGSQLLSSSATRSATGSYGDYTKGANRRRISLSSLTQMWSK